MPGGRKIVRRWIAGTGLLAVVANAAPAATLDDIGQALQARFGSIDAGAPPAPLRQQLGAYPLLRAFYAARGFEPLWHRGDHAPPPAAADLLAALRDAARDGMAPADYHYTELDGWLREPSAAGGGDATDAADTELLLSDAFVMLAYHLRDGRIDPITLVPRRQLRASNGALAAALLEAGRDGNLSAVLNRFQPSHPGFTKLRAVLALLYDIEAGGGWPLLPEGPTLRPGDEDPRVITLRARLATEQLLVLGRHARSPLFGPAVEHAVRRFQRRYNLAVDGVVGKETLAALAVPTTLRIAQVQANLERWRWLPQDLGRRYVLVNIANFDLIAVEDDHVALHMRVVVGKPYRETPVFSDQIRYLVFNPVWDVPPTILRKDVLPQVIADPRYLERRQFRVFRKANGELTRIDPKTVDWAALATNGERSSIRLSQAPGPDNPLGRVKFMFPNSYDVYLHDTPARELFNKRVRDFSSGCIRVENAGDLVKFVLRDNPAWTDEAVQTILDAGKERMVNLTHPVPVHIQYWTVWLDDDGELRFRNDVYGRDAALAEALALR